MLHFATGLSSGRSTYEFPTTIFAQPTSYTMPTRISIWFSTWLLQYVPICCELQASVFQRIRYNKYQRYRCVLFTSRVILYIDLSTLLSETIPLLIHHSDGEK